MEERRPSPLTKYSRQIASVVMACLFLILAALLTTYTTCSFWPWLCFDGVYYLAVLVAALSVIIPVGLGYRLKAIKTARGRLPMRPLTEYGLTSFSLNTFNPLHKPDTIPMRDELTRGWQIPFSDGLETIYVNVYKMELYRWLVDCYSRQTWLTGKQSAISRRLNRKLDNQQWQARIELLKRSNSVYRNSTACNSTLYLRQFEDMGPVEAAWHIVDELLEAVEESRKIW